jgi:hypothetical protein
VPVLSWLLCAERSCQTREHASVQRSHSRPLSGPGTGPRPATVHTALRQRDHDQSTGPPPNPRQLPTAARPAQPSEPIFFPKLQIHFADFPYLHASSGREAIHLGDLLRIWVRSGTKITLSLGVSRTDTCAPDTARTAVLYGHHLPIAG